MNVDASVAAKTLHGFDYTSISVDKLGATEYTVVGIVVDQTTSVSPFKDDLEKMLAASIGSCRESPRSLNLLVRSTVFNSNCGIEELHGFTLLSSINPDDFVGTIQPNGSTNLYDAGLDAVETLYEYVKKLYDDEVICNANGIVFIITDGDDNASRINTPAMIKEAIDKIRRAEALESIRTILIGVNDTDTYFRDRLETLRQEASIDEYLSMGEVTEKKLAKLAQFVSQSISSTSQSLGTGQPSQPVDFKF